MERTVEYIEYIGTDVEQREKSCGTIYWNEERRRRAIVQTVSITFLKAEHAKLRNLLYVHFFLFKILYF